MTSSFLSPSSLVPISLFIILILLPYSRPLLLQDTLLHIPPPSCFLFHNGGRCRRLLPNVQSITHVPVLVILIVSNTNVQCITHRCNQAALFYLVSQSLYFWIVTQQYYKFFQCSKWPKKLNVSMHPLFKCISVNQHQGDQGAFFVSVLTWQQFHQVRLSCLCSVHVRPLVSFLCFSTAKLLLPMAHYFILSSACHPLLWEEQW